MLTNQTPFALLINYRLNKAIEILSKKKMAVNEVYVMTGFKSRTHFVKVFKDKYKSTPSKYATKKSGKHESN
jgi:transcriptional regulator GlxA family with amidase domain